MQGEMEVYFLILGRKALPVVKKSGKSREIQEEEKMKKLIALLLVMVLGISLVACGGPDRQPAIDAFNKAKDAFNEVAIYMNENQELFFEEEIDIMIEFSSVLEQHKAKLEGKDELTQEQLDEMIAWYGDVVDWADQIKADYGIE